MVLMIKVDCERRVYVFQFFHSRRNEAPGIGGGGVGGVNWLHNQTFPNFEHFFFNSLQKHSRVGSQEAAALTVGAEIFLYL